MTLTTNPSNNLTEKKPRLIVILGPTGVGKTSVSIALAKALGTDVFSSDSRQIYKETKIGTDAPTKEKMQGVRHHFIGHKSITEYYSASMYEEEALEALSHYFEAKTTAILCGGSMMYTDAVCFGIDKMPDVNPKVRQEVYDRYNKEGLHFAVESLKKLDPDYLTKVDLNNHKRLLHALEVCISSGRSYTSFHTGERAVRPFHIVRIGIVRDRTELYERINERVLQMVDNGLVEEARSLLPFRHLNALNTVGYKEMFQYLDGNYTLDEAIAKIQKNTRQYARKQLTWYRKEEDIQWFHPDELDAILDYLQKCS